MVSLRRTGIARGPKGDTGESGPAGAAGADGADGVEAVTLSGWPIYTYGASYLVTPAGWHTTGEHSTDLLRDYHGGGTVTSYAVGGRRILDVCGTLINGADLPGCTGVVTAGKWVSTSARSGLVILDAIVNDTGHYPNQSAVPVVPAAITTGNTKYLDCLKHMYRTALAIMSSESRVENSTGTTSGTWVTADIPSASSSGSSVGYTQNFGAGMTWTITPPQTGPLAGRIYFLTYTLDAAVAAVTATINVQIDGGSAVPATVPIWEAYTGNDGTSSYQSPICIPIDVPVDGATHTVKVSHAGAGGSLMYSDTLFVPSVDPNPILVRGNEHPLLAHAGVFDAAGISAYNANRQRVAAAVRAVVAEFPNAIYVPNTMTTSGLYSGDGVHPNDRGQAQIAAADGAALATIKARLDARAQAQLADGTFGII